jgi:uncharacterized membrane protein
VIAFTASIAAYDYLPSYIPVHWSITGQIDKELHKQLGAYLYPAAMALVYIFFRLIPFADRNRVRQLKEIGAYDMLRFGAVLLFAYGHVLTLGIGLDWVSREANFLVGAAVILLALLADHAGKAEPDWLAGLLRQRAPFLRVSSLAQAIKVACGLAVLGTLTGKWQPAWLLLPALATVFAVLCAARRRL